MEELYWIHVIGNIHSLCIIIAILAAILDAGLIAIIIIISDNSEMLRKMLKKFRITIVSLIITIISFSTISTFILSKEELYIVYGIGGTIDYIKSNDKAKKLPDKVVNAVDAYLESTVGKNNDKTVNPADRSKSGGK